ncbi:prepilin-type N-terminal cleavage/methylation domain-containing protein [Xanthobacter sediminis]
MTCARDRAAGFTLVEVLVTLVLAGLVVSVLATVTRQWLPNWRRGIDRVENVERVGLALRRVTADLAATEFVPAALDRPLPLFDGTASSITFVRTALGPNAQPGLEIVRLAEADGGGLVRSAAPYAPRDAEAPPVAFGAPVLLLRPPYRLEFSYSGRDGLWLDAWTDLDELPRAVRIVVRDARTGRTLDVSTVAALRTELPADCVTESSRANCGGNSNSNGDKTDGTGKDDTGGGATP